MDNTLLVAIVGGAAAQFVVGLFNSLTMRTRTEADIKAAMIKAATDSAKNENDAEQQLINQWIAAYKIQADELKAAKEEVKELKAELRQFTAGSLAVKDAVVEGAETLIARRGIEL